MTRAEIESFNQNTWQWGGCASQIFFGQKVCLSPGVPPRPDIDPKAECGLTNINNSTCPLNACCSRWGYCGNGPDFCTFKTGPPGLGCQSNCGGAPPPVCTNTMQYKVGYYASWSTNRPAGCPRSGPASFANSPFTHLHFAFGGIDGNGQLSVTSPQFAEFASIKTINPSMKLIISVGGWAFNDVPVTNNQPDTSGYYSRMVSSSSSRSVFINSVKSFLSQYNLDGIDFDWEYPTAPDRHGTSADGQNYVSLLRELRQAVGNSYSISIAAPASFWYLKGFDIAGMSQYLDYIVYMTYDMHGNWDYANQFVGPSLNVHNNFTEIVQAISMIEKAGVPSNKLLLGLGYYGRSFKLQSSSCTTPGVCQFEDPGTMVVIGNELQYPNTALAGRCTNTGGYLANFEIKDIIARQGVVPRFDGPSLSNILVYNNGRDWIGYDDAQSMSGTAVWSIDQSWDLNIVSAPACGKHSTLDLNNQCACDADFAFINGYCYYTKCQQNSVWNSDQDACVCNVGFQGSNCTPIPPPTCPEHASVNLFNVCVCDHDFEFQNGVCVYTKCRPNSQWVNDQCVCLNGFEGSDCHPVCQSGFAWNGKQCSLIMILDPICIPGHSCVPVTPGPFPISITLPFSFPGVPIPLVIPSLPFSLNLPGISAPVDVTGESQQDKDKDNEQPSKWDTPTFVSCIYNDPIFDFGVQVSAKLLNPPKDKGRWINICKSLPLTVSDEQLYATTCTVSSDTVTGTFAVDFVDTYDFPEAISCYKPDDFGSYVSSCPLKTGMNKRAPQCDIKSILGTDITPDYWTIQNILAEMKEMNTYVYVPPAEKEDIDMYGKALPDYDFVEAYNNRYPDTAVTVEQVPNKLPVTTFASRNYVFRALNKQDIKTLINNNNNMVPKDQSKKAKYKYLPLDHVAKFAGNSDNFISTTYDMDAARRYAINPLLDGANYNYFVMISLNSPKLVGGGFIDLTVPAVINQCKLDYRTAINVRNRGKRVNKKETTSPEIQNDWDLFHRWVTQVSEVLVETQIPKENIVFQVKVYRQSGAVYFIPKFIETHPWNAGCKARGEDYLCNYSQ
ncbi:hypothetical protein HK103_006070 [Boothiomyces macroporosus]|uniref:Chitinase n=1 Tax=Boothiomyces macroporosus TaxID=261099 RepID=A0AAD5UEW4_9FUNG|nr:hypothetical protein HK103_006070 [Boothiomyces macroporosus]